MRGYGLKKITILQFVIFLFIFNTVSYTGGIEREGRIYPLPLIEVQHLLSRWLVESGFEVIQKDLGESQIQMKGQKGDDLWEITLSPRSPLGTIIQPRFIQKGHRVQEKNSEIWVYLDQYLRGDQEGTVFENIPNKIKGYLDSVVCIQGTLKEGDVQFTGFIIDRRGLILSTSHDLKGIQEMWITHPHGAKEKGRVVKVDSLRDLLLIDIPTKPVTSIPIYQTRAILREGERVYSIGCPNNHKKMLVGTVEAPLREVHHLPLIQVRMEIQPGSSGSPVFDREGNLIGIIKGRYRGDSSTGFMIPLSTILEFLKEK